MSGRTARGGALVSLLALGCSASAAAPDPAAALRPLGVFALGPEGVTVPIRLPLGDAPHGVVLRAVPVPVMLTPLPCLELASLRTSAGEAWIPAGGPSGCPGCPPGQHRFTAGRGAGLYIVPDDGADFVAPEALIFQIGLRDCDSGLRYEPDGAAPDQVAVDVRPLGPPLAGPARVRLRLAFPGGIPFTSSDHPIIRRALAELAERLGSAQIEPEVLPGPSLPGSVLPEIPFSSLANPTLDRLWQDVAHAAQATNDGPGAVPVVFLSCLWRDDPGQGRTLLAGHVPRVPGGLGAGPAADAVFLSSPGCRGRPRDDDSAGRELGTILAHEVGHYLGLFHTVEADGSSDHLPDTDARNLMYHDPLAAGASGLSPAQVRILRRHPYVHPGTAGR